MGPEGPGGRPGPEPRGVPDTTPEAESRAGESDVPAGPERGVVVREAGEWRAAVAMEPLLPQVSRPARGLPPMTP